MSASSSPYLQSDDDTDTALEHALRPLTSTMEHSNIDTFDDGSMFGSGLQLTTLPFTTYEVGFQSSFFTADLCGEDNTLLPPFQPNRISSCYTPISEASDFSETLTPISLRPTIDLRGSPRLALTTHPSPVTPHVELPSPSRPCSSSSLFHFPPPRVHTPEPRKPVRDGLGIENSNKPTPVASPMPQDTPKTPSLHRSIPPLPRRYYTPIAPNPVGLRQLQANANKRSLSSDDDVEPPFKKRRVSEASSPIAPIEVSEEDSFLLRLRDEEGLTWKDIAARFQTELSKVVQIPALQMRLKRLRERMMVWTENEVQALRLAHDHWISHKFDIIASKMADLGALEKWSGRQCLRKWQEIGFPYESNLSQLGRTPTFSTVYSSSPIENSPHHGSFPFVSAS